MYVYITGADTLHLYYIWLNWQSVYLRGAHPRLHYPFRARLLRRKFAERFTSPDARSDVNYVAFLTAVDMAAAGHDKVCLLFVRTPSWQ